MIYLYYILEYHYVMIYDILICFIFILEILHYIFNIYYLIHNKK